MKKRYLMVFLVCLFLFPFGIHAKEGIDNYYIDATVKKNGDLEVTEVFVLNGDYNGFERILVYQNNNVPSFNGDKNSFQGSSIYNGTGITIQEVGAIPVSGSYDFSLLKQEPELFEKKDYNTTGSYGGYSLNRGNRQATLRIYNPSSYHSAFYVKYTVHNMAVLHNDYGELYWNLFSDQLVEGIEHLELYVHLEGNSEVPKVWAHGPLHGEVRATNEETVFLSIDHLDAHTAIDVRTLFDKIVISESVKRSNVDALEPILEVEQERANQANKLRTRAKIIYYAFLILNAGWLLGLGVLVYYMYSKYDKEYQPEFKGKYFRDFPNDYGPEIVGYLFNRKIENNEFSAAMLNLIADKVVSFEEIGKDDFKLTYLPAGRQLKKSDEILISWIFGKIGSNNQVTLKQIQQYAKKNYDPFLNRYSAWKNAALAEAQEKNFYENIGSKKSMAGIYCLAGIIIAIFTFALTDAYILGIVTLVLGFIALFYFAMMTKRTKQGNEDYAKWKGLRNFMEDFGNFSAKELPAITLWEKYLVYASVFGLAKKLSKQMEMKFSEMPESNYTVADYYFDRHYMYMMANFSRTMNTSMTRSISNARASYSAAHSSSSSGSGGGGGFSSGGGFGGGGGGGGRF